MKTFYFSLLASLFTLISFAQEKKAEVDVNIDKGGGDNNWYASPLIWIIGAAVFILLLVALTRGRSRA